MTVTEQPDNVSDLAQQETVRRAYLSAMGISPWYARVPVAGGAVSLWPDEEVAVQASRPVVIAVPEPKQPQPAPHAVVSAPEQHQHSPEKTTERPATPELKTKDVPPLPDGDTARAATSGRQTGIEFQQQWWGRDGWLIVDTRPKHMPVSQAQAADRLLHALGFVLTGEGRATFNQWIDWPLFVNRSIKHDIEEAQFYLAQKWQAAQHTGAIHKLLLLGERSPELLACMPAGVDARSPWQWGEVSCLLGPSSSELLHLPGLKKAFWQRLEPWMKS